jgi:nucleoside-diphosphate-sugar epimerase
MAKMNCLVTGVAGFIGSHLTEKLIDEGHSVIGVDAFEPFYPRRSKEANLFGVRDKSAFTMIEGNLLDLDLSRIVSQVDCIFHEAAQPGVRDSWGGRFEVYAHNNILATQKLLEASVGTRIRRFVYASSSSVYGEVEDLPITETAFLRPHSPYGVSKLAGEHLCVLYWRNFSVPCVALRYFTAYGPRQRPDMAFHKFIKAMLHGEEIEVYGDGSQSRDYTFIEDIVRATVGTMDKEVVGEVMNVGCGRSTTVTEVIAALEAIMGRKAKRRFLGQKSGDLAHTLADISKAKRVLGYEPLVSLPEGLEREVEWLEGQA